MFERLVARAERRAQMRALERAERLAAGLRDALPTGISAEAGASGVILTGHALRRRFALDRRLLWLIAGLR
jgi:hypothetical protein